MAEEPLAQYPYFLPNAAGEGVLLLQTFGSAMGAPARPAHVRDGQQGADEARHPIIAVGDVVEQVEPVFSMEPPGDKIRVYLPQVVVDLVASLKA